MIGGASYWEILCQLKAKSGVNGVVKHRNIILVGLMGTGKSTVGKALAERLGWLFVDSDERIEQVEKKKISDIFAESGEPAFRKVESRVIAELAQGSEQIIATGGGAVLAEENRIVMKENGLVVALTATADEIIARVSGDTSRPLVQGNVAERVQAIMESRKHAYDFADVHIATTGAAVSEIVEAIVQHRSDVTA